MHSERRTDHPDKNALIQQFSAFLSNAAILADPEDLKPYACDGLSAYQKIPWLVVLPDTVDQVRKVMRICSREGVPVVARGAGTGLSGGALPVKNGVLLGLAKFNKILDIDALNRTARVQPGVRNLAISEASKPYGLYYAPDPSSQIACTIGGNVAENSGGVHCLKYGLTVHNVLQLSIVTVDGELVTIGGSGLDSPGFDLLALLTGSEGMLGVIVEVVVKLLPKPQATQILLASFDSVEKAGRAVAAVISAGHLPAGLEMMDNAAIRAVEDFVEIGYPLDAEAILLCELDGASESLAEEVAAVKSLLLAVAATEVRIACDDNEKQRFWAGRKAAFPAMGRISPDYLCMDGTIPRQHIGSVLTQINDLSKHYGFHVANVFHAGDGNLHPLILYDANSPGEQEQAEVLGGEILALCVKVGGVITGEHGVGVEKLNQMCIQFSPQELTQFHAVKSAFDPEGLLNPGKAIPTLRRCAEFGAMHVHSGKLPHPELERF